jgi:hypothetical protein
VELEYTELLVPTEGIYELVYPTVVGPRYSSQAEATAPQDSKWVSSPYLHEGAAPTYALTLSGRISSALPIRDLSIPTHAADLRWNGGSEVGFALKPTETAGGNRDFVLRYRLTGERIESGLKLYGGGQENFFLLMVGPPQRVSPEQLPPREYVFILDVSGSMHGFPLETAKQVMRELAQGLRPVDRFNVILFSGASALMSPAPGGRAAVHRRAERRRGHRAALRARGGARPAFRARRRTQLRGGDGRLHQPGARGVRDHPQEPGHRECVLLRHRLRGEPLPRGRRGQGRPR